MKFTVSVTKIPTAYNSPACYVVEAETEDDARAIVKDRIGDLSGEHVYVYKVKPYVPPPAGRIVGTVA